MKKYILLLTLITIGYVNADSLDQERIQLQQDKVKFAQDKLSQALEIANEAKKNLQSEQEKLNNLKGTTGSIFNFGNTKSDNSKKETKTTGGLGTFLEELQKQLGL